MEKIRIGILSPSNIAFTRFLPSLKKSMNFEYVGIALANKEEWFQSSGRLSNELEKVDHEKANRFVENFEGKIFNGYKELIENSNIDAVYIPLPPELHFEWAKRALKAGKHVLIEKPSTTSYDKTVELIKIAKEKNLALHENYMFPYHNQLYKIKNMIENKKLGDIRTYRMSFGFPMRPENDFRYNKSMGGGALLDCGGYPVKLANILLGDTSKVVYSKLNYVDKFDVDLFGNVIMENEDGIMAQISFGMDNAYQCQLEVWGSKMTLIAPRIFTAGTDIKPTLILKTSSGEEIQELASDDQFLNSIEHFYKCISQIDVREKTYCNIEKQAEMIEKIIEREKKK